MDKAQLTTIQKLIGERLLAQLTDPDKIPRASTINAAISYLRLFPQFVDRLGVDNAQDITDAVRATIAKCGPLPDLPPVTESFGGDDDDDNDSSSDF